ncbi:hypothetical protein [Arcobacter sp.]|uniref:hypothetical protein n=1 Tax=Arcobacter sp. TaxID=1872629 RepID=UPI003D12C12B
MYKVGFFSFMVVWMLSGCAGQMQQADNEARIKQLNTPVDVKVGVPFDEAQAKVALALGNCNLKGVLYHKVISYGKSAGQDPLLSMSSAKYLSNVDVVLYPVTAHLLELMRLEDENLSRLSLWSKDKQLKRFIPDERIYKYSLITKTDKFGRYFFNQLKPGRYFIIVADQDIFSTGTEVVRDGTSVVSDGYYSADVAHYRNQNFRVKTPVHYEEYIEIKPEQKELVLESRMRMRKF